MYSYWQRKITILSRANANLWRTLPTTTHNRTHKGVRYFPRAHSPRLVVGSCGLSFQHDSQSPTNHAATWPCTHACASTTPRGCVACDLETITHNGPRLSGLGLSVSFASGNSAPGQGPGLGAFRFGGVAKTFLFFMQNFDRPRPNPYTPTTRIMRRERHVQVITADHPRSEGH